jgi:hypothetical protein
VQAGIYVDEQFRKYNESIQNPQPFVAIPIPTSTPPTVYSCLLSKLLKVAPGTTLDTVLILLEPIISVWFTLGLAYLVYYLVQRCQKPRAPATYSRVGPQPMARGRPWDDAYSEQDQDQDQGHTKPYKYAPDGAHVNREPHPM